MSARPRASRTETRIIRLRCASRNCVTAGSARSDAPWLSLMRTTQVMSTVLCAKIASLSVSTAFRVTYRVPHPFKVRWRYMHSDIAGRTSEMWQLPTRSLMTVSTSVFAVRSESRDCTCDLYAMFVLATRHTSPSMSEPEVVSSPEATFPSSMNQNRNGAPPDANRIKPATQLALATQHNSDTIIRTGK